MRGSAKKHWTGFRGTRLSNVAAFIQAEERARANALYLSAEVAQAASHRGVSEMLPVIEGQRQPWLDMAVPCPDLLFESLPAIPDSGEEWLSWYALNEARGGMLQVSLHSLREITQWVDLSRQSERRKAIVQHAIGGLLRNGMGALLPIVLDLWARVLLVCSFFQKNGMKVYDPPALDFARGMERDAAEMREKVKAATQDFFLRACRRS